MNVNKNFKELGGGPSVITNQNECCYGLSRLYICVYVYVYSMAWLWFAAGGYGGEESAPLSWAT